MVLVKVVQIQGAPKDTEALQISYRSEKDRLNVISMLTQALNLTKEPYHGETIVKTISIWIPNK